MNQKLLIYRFTILATCLCASNFVTAQSMPELKEPTTVEEVYDRFYNAIGLKSHPEASYFSKQSKSVSKSINKTLNSTSVSKEIEVMDFKKQTIAKVLSSKIMDNKPTIIKYVKTLEKTFMFSENGETTELPSQLKPHSFKMNFIEEPMDSSKATLIPSELFNGEECYVILIKSKINIHPSETIMDRYEFFSVKTGLKIGFKSITKSTIKGIPDKEEPRYSTPESVSTSISSVQYQNFQKVDNLILHHKEIFVVEINTSVSGNEYISSIETKTEIKYNIDPEHFKNVTFKSPEEAIAEIPDDL